MKDKKVMKKITESLKVEPGLILLHHNADIDAVGSAIALKSAYPKFTIGAFDKISQVSKQLLGKFEDFSILSQPNLENFNTIVVLDTSTPSQLGISIDQLNNYIVIDHHVETNHWNTDVYYCDSDKTSCAEIIFELLESIDFTITPTVALALAVAILADTGHFKYATHETFLTFARLLELGDLNAGEVFEVLANTGEMDRSQRIAHLKGAQRLRFEQIYGYLIATSSLSSYEASMCKHLISLGADVAFVGAQRDEEIRVSGRITREMIELGLNLGEFFQELGAELMCEGGGHDGAGGLNGIGDVELVLNACIGKVTKILKHIKR
ncbi:DHH family phosphoesterase [[Eubacterium] cellulosolvens]